MERVRLFNLKAGQTLHQALFTLGGQKLLGAGVTLNDRHLLALQRSGETEAVLADSLDELVEAGLIVHVDSAKLAVGQKVKDGLMTSAGRVIVEAGEALEEHHLEALRAGGEGFAAKDDKTTQGGMRRERVLLAEALVEQVEQESDRLSKRVTGGDSSWITPKPVDQWPGPEDLAALRTQHVETVRKLFARIEAGLPVPSMLFEPILESLIKFLAHHPAQFTQLALLCPRREDYLPDHAYTVAVLAMAMGAALKWPREHARDVGLAGLLCDLGMLMVPERIRVGCSQLSEIDRGRVQRHPIFSLAMLEQIDSTGALVRLTAYQHHERENGSGYPKGVRREQVCDYARVVAVADSYAAATEPRTYRNPKLPYIAMEETLRATATMVFWKPATRALVQAAGLFPVGSHVRLSDGRNAAVLAANATVLDRPIVQPVDNDGVAKGEPIDLALVAKESLAIVRPISGPRG